MTHCCDPSFLILHFQVLIIERKVLLNLIISTDFCCIDFYFFLTVSQYLSSWINVVKTLPNLSFYLISERMKLHQVVSSRARQIFSQLVVIKPVEVIPGMITASPLSLTLFSTTRAWQPHSQHVWLKPQNRHIFSINWWLSTICFPQFWSHLSLPEGSLISFWSREAWFSLLHFQTGAIIKSVLQNIICVEDYISQCWQKAQTLPGN